jgi:hypothetical protein
MTTAELLSVIEREIGERGWSVLIGSLSPRLKQVFRQSAISFLQEALVQERPDFALVDEHAAGYAAERAAELIKDFAATTPEMLRATIEKAIREGWSSVRLSDELAESYAFSDVRALAIARTEVARARNHGVDAGARRAAFEEKSWVLDEAACPVCQMNAGAGWIAIDNAFPSGDMLAPAHPNCSCTVGYRRGSQADASSH